MEKESIIYLRWYQQPIVYAFVAQLIFITLISYLGYRELKNLESELTETHVVHLKKIQFLDSMVHHSRQRQVLLRDIALSMDPFLQDELIQQHHSQAFKYLEARNGLVALTASGKETEIMQLIIRYNNEAYGQQLEILELSVNEETDQAIELIRTELGPNREKIYPLMLEFRDMLVENSSLAIQRDQRRSNQARERIIFLYVLVLVLGSLAALLAYFVQRRHHRAAVWQATHDSLTGIANRFQFESTFSRVTGHDESSRFFALVFLDLDQFKLVNDTAGHSAGDELLRQVAASLSDHLPLGSELARVGGDEFAILVPDADPANAASLGEGLLHHFSTQKFMWTDHIFNVSASMGIVVFQPGEMSKDELFAAADIACHTAKENGRNRYQVFSADDNTAHSRVEQMLWVTRLKQPDVDRHIQLFQQPIIQVGQPDTVYRREILLRYRSDAGEVHGAQMIVNAAEKYDFGHKLDEAVMDKAVRAIGALPTDFGAFNINLSGQSLASRTTLEKIVSAVDGSGMDPGRFCFEITETSAITR